MLDSYASPVPPEQRERDAAASSHPSQLPPPPPRHDVAGSQTGPNWRSARVRNPVQRHSFVPEGGSDTPAVEPVPRQAQKRKRRSVSSQPVPESRDAVQSYPSSPEDDQQASAFFRDNFFKRVVAGYESDSAVSPGSEHVPAVADSEGLRWTTQQQLYVPDYETLRKECFESVHSMPWMGHYGTQRTQEKALQLFYWPGIKRDIKHWISQCDSCQRVKPVRQKPHGLLHPLAVPERRWDDVSMDFITDLPVTKQGHDAIWVVVDLLSKMVHLEPCKKTITAEGTAELYEKAIFRLHGLPKSIVSDRDVRFVSEFWRAIQKRFKTDLRMSTKNHPQTDGQTENANQVLEDTLRHFVGPYQQDWEKILPVAEFAMNNSFNSSIGMTPFMMNYAQNPRDPTTAWIEHRNPAVNKFMGRWSEQLARAKQHLADAKSRQKRFADKHRRDTPVWVPGTEVLLSSKFFRLPESQTRKLSPRWIGPFKVVKAVGNHHLAYELDLPQALNRMHPVFHVSALREYKRSPNSRPPPLPTFVDGELEFEVSHISDTRYTGSRRQYRIHWEGDRDQDTWEPVQNLRHCAAKINEFWEARREAIPPDALPPDVQPWPTPVKSVGV